MTPYQWILLAGAFGTIVIIWQNWLSFQDTRTQLENRLRERLNGRGDRKGKMAVAVDEIRLHELSRPAKLKWYFGLGIDTGSEIKVETNMNLDESVWEAVEKSFDQMDEVFPTVEFLGSYDSPEGETFLSILKIESCDESEIMRTVCAIPTVVDKMELNYELEESLSPAPFDVPDDYEEKVNRYVEE